MRSTKRATLLLILAIGCAGGCNRGGPAPEKGGPALAKYSDFEVEGVSDFDIFRSSAQDAGIAKIYAKFPDGEVYFLPELPEEVAAATLRKFESEIRTPDPGVARYWLDERFLLRYRDGELRFVSAKRRLPEIGFGPTADGPFIYFPVKRDRFIEVFGEPKEWDRPSPKPRGP